MTNVGWRGAVDGWKRNARLLKRELFTLYIAYKDPRVPLPARIIAACVVAYAFSPIDLIPDPIPVLGYLDDLILVPAGILLARRLIPAQVLVEARVQAEEAMSKPKPVNWVAAAVIIAVWLALAALVTAFIWWNFAG